MIRKNFINLVVCFFLFAPSNAWADPAYSVLDTGDPSEPVCNPRSYTDLGNGIIRDNVTGLEWQQVPKSTFDTWYNASAYCDTLTLPPGGYSDWRLPTIEELASLVDCGRDEPAISPLFSITTNFEYWSSTPNASSNTAWYVNFDYGWVNYDSQSNTKSVRAIRGPYYEAVGTFVVNNDGTASDPNTGLMWQQCNSGQSWSAAQCNGSAVPGQWDQAVTYIEDLNDANHLGYDDWRLPTRNELQSLLDYSRSNPATLFPNTQNENYWSLTLLAGYTDDTAWGVSFEDGYVSAYNKDASMYIRAVRSGACWFDEDGDCLADTDCENGRPCFFGKCFCQNNAQCDDSVDCNGEETCDSGACIEGTTTCAVGKYCDESIDACVECLSDDHCDDVVFCNGVEMCTAGLCTSGTFPCEAGELCNEDADQCVECFVDEDCPDDTLFCTGAPRCEDRLCGFDDPCTDETPSCDEANDQCVAGFMQSDKASIKAGKKTDTDSIQLSGLLDTSAGDLNAAIGNTIIVSLTAASIPGSGTIEYSFPVEAENLSNGKYTSPKIKTAPVTSLTLDTNKGTFKFSAKKADLTGLSCPITCMIEIGDEIYSAEATIDEDIVNGPKKPCPLQFIMGLQDSLDATKVRAKKSTKADADSISISGTFTIDGVFDMNQPLIMMIGSDTFTVPGVEFVVKKTSYSCKSFNTGDGLVTAKFDTAKCTFSISIKSTTLSDSGDVDFGLVVFNNPLTASTQIELPPNP